MLQTRLGETKSSRPVALLLIAGTPALMHKKTTEAAERGKIMLSPPV